MKHTLKQRLNRILIFAGLIALSCGFTLQMSAQTDPVSWVNSLKKINAHTYELHLTAKVVAPWHMYSQTQPVGAIPMPTKLIFIKNPMISLVGDAKEIGKLEMHEDATLGSTDRRYSKELEFVQVIILKGSAKTNVVGSVTYQVCTDEQCLLPRTMNFNIKIE